MSLSFFPPKGFIFLSGYNHRRLLYFPLGLDLLFISTRAPLNVTDDNQRQRLRTWSQSQVCLLHILRTRSFEKIFSLNYYRWLTTSELTEQKRVTELLFVGVNCEETYKCV